MLWRLALCSMVVSIFLCSPANAEHPYNLRGTAFNSRHLAFNSAHYAYISRTTSLNRHNSQLIRQRSPINWRNGERKWHNRPRLRGKHSPIYWNYAPYRCYGPESRGHEEKDIIVVFPAVRTKSPAPHMETLDIKDPTHPRSGRPPTASPTNEQHTIIVYGTEGTDGIYQHPQTPGQVVFSQPILVYGLDEQ